MMPAMIAASTAMFLGLVTYPRQKRLDRQSEVLRERREIYLEYVEASQSAYWDSGQTTLEEHLKRRSRYFQARERLRIVAPDAVLGAVDHHTPLIAELLRLEGLWIGRNDINSDRLSRQLSDALPPERVAFVDVITEMRKDTVSHSSYRPNFPELKRASNSEP